MLRFASRGNGAFDVPGGGLVPVAEHVPVIMGHDGLRYFARAKFLPTDDDRDLDPLPGHRIESRLQSGAFR
jgi:hypothetical protein